jgi:hypothetical protein
MAKEFHNRPFFEFSSDIIPSFCFKLTLLSAKPQRYNSKMKLKEIFRSEQYYSICECDRTDKYMIDVTCGGICMYSRIVQLTDKEIEIFKNDGHLDDLAYKIAKGDKRILEREIVPEDRDEKIEYR